MFLFKYDIFIDLKNMENRISRYAKILNRTDEIFRRLKFFDGHNRPNVVELTTKIITDKNLTDENIDRRKL